MISITGGLINEYHLVARRGRGFRHAHRHRVGPALVQSDGSVRVDRPLPVEVIQIAPASGHVPVFSVGRVGELDPPKAVRQVHGHDVGAISPERCCNDLRLIVRVPLCHGRPGQARIG